MKVRLSTPEVLIDSIRQTFLGSYLDPQELTTYCSDIGGREGAEKCISLRSREVRLFRGRSTIDI